MAKKHIKIKVTALPDTDFQKVKVEIMEQSHRGTDFGKAGDTFFQYGGYTLASSAQPQNYSDNKAFLRGYYGSYDNNPITLTTAQYAKFVAAVRAYNTYFAAPAQNPCGYIIG